MFLARCLLPFRTRRTAESPVEQWVTPREQLALLYAPIVKEVSARALPVVAVASIVAEYAAGILSDWYTALKTIDMLPEKVPLLTSNIHQILATKCPIFGDKQKPDGTFPSIGETHSFYLIPNGTLNTFVNHAEAYGKKHYAKQIEEKQDNPLQLKECVGRRFVSDVPFRAEWILISNHPLPQSWIQSRDEEREQMVQNLNALSPPRYKIPTLKQAVVFIFLDLIARRQVHMDRTADCPYIIVQETDQHAHVTAPTNTRLIVGYAGPDGLIVRVGQRYFKHDGVGTLAVRELR